jgi:propionyl-CoA synthetase
MPHPQDDVQAYSLSDPESFWKHQASHLHWHKQPSKILKRTSKKLKSGFAHNHWEWFPDAEISTCYNCIDRHVEAGNGDNVAIIWDSPVTGSKEKFTYKQLQSEVEVFAGVLREEGIKKGDVVLIYSSYSPCRLENNR